MKVRYPIFLWQTVFSLFAWQMGVVGKLFIVYGQVEGCIRLDV